MARPTLGILRLAALALALSGCLSDCGSDIDTCPSGRTRCGGMCVDTATDADHCGACGVACGDGTCAGGVCQCAGATVRCDALVPRCRDLQSDPGACGACTTPCTRLGEGCAAGACGCFPPRPDDCGTFCTDTQTDAANCASAGGCGFACPLTNDVCEAGTCTCPASLPTPCPTGTPTTCVNTETDPANCSACGTSCPLTNDVCVGGVCQCPGSLPDPCGDTCVSLDVDEENCGTCGKVCAGGATCTGGPPAQCVCPPGAPDVCGPTCVDRQTDERNCGTCGNTCATGAACTTGSCRCPNGPVLGCNGACCAGGTSCCLGGGCPLAHSNGLGGSYFDCGALDEHTLAQARLAAESWAPGTTTEVGLCSTFCLCRQTATQAAVWCYAGSPNKGLVQVTNSPNCLAASCPFPGYGVQWH